MKADLGLRNFNHITRLITLSVITLSGLNGNTVKASIINQEM
jgi:hypothetical protein